MHVSSLPGSCPSYTAHPGSATEKANRLEGFVLMDMFNGSLSVTLIYAIYISQPLMNRSIPMF